MYFWTSWSTFDHYQRFYLPYIWRHYICLGDEEVLSNGYICGKRLFFSPNVSILEQSADYSLYNSVLIVVRYIVINLLRRHLCQLNNDISHFYVEWKIDTTFVCASNYSRRYYWFVLDFSCLFVLVKSTRIPNILLPRQITTYLVCTSCAVPLLPLVFLSPLNMESASLPVFRVSLGCFKRGETVFG